MVDEFHDGVQEDQGNQDPEDKPPYVHTAVIGVEAAHQKPCPEGGRHNHTYLDNPFCLGECHSRLCRL